MKVYYETHGEGFCFDGAYAAFEGAGHKSFERKGFVSSDEVPSPRWNVYNLPTIILVGSVNETEKYFRRLRFPVPVAIDKFKELNEAGLVTRKITYGWIGDLSNINQPIFMKPRYKVKGCIAGVYSGKNDIRLVSGITDEDKSMELMFSEVVDMQSEYRVYVRLIRDKRIAGIKHYNGDPFLMVDKTYVEKVVDFLCSLPDMPAAFAVDFAVCGDGSTTVVEIQDAWSIGSYGLDGEIYLGFLMDRWIQMFRNL